MLDGIENASFGYNLISEKWIYEGSGPLAGGPSDSQIMSPGAEWFAPYMTPRDFIKLDFKKSISQDLQYVHKIDAR